MRRGGYLPGMYPSKHFLKNVSRFARFAVASYGSSFLRLTGAVSKLDGVPVQQDPAHLAEHQSFSSYARLPPSTVLLSSFVDPHGGTNAAGETDTGMPLVHYISLDHDSKAVVLTCRGTLGFEDVLTDMTCDYDNLIWRGKAYPVHKGMYASARRLLTMHGGRVVATLKAALEEHRDYGLVLCGHSLGGGVVSLLAIMLAQVNTTSAGSVSVFVTASQPLAQKDCKSTEVYEFPALPTDRSIHVYAYGPPATISPSLQRATRGLITTVINSGDLVPYLSLGTLRDFQAVALAFKIDTKDAKGEVRRRVWDGFRQSFRDRIGLGEFSGVFANNLFRSEQEEDDQWPWAALKSLRAAMLAEKLVPPGEVFVVEAKPVLQRYAFVAEASSSRAEDGADAKIAGQSFRPATHAKLTYIAEVETRFGEIRFGASMFADHMPARYEKALLALEMGVMGVVI